MISLNRTNILCFIVATFIIAGCNHEKPFSDYSFEGKWQSLNDPEAVFEFTDNNKIDLYRNGESFWSTAAVNGELKYELKRLSQSWYTFSTFDGQELFIQGRIELVTQDRIRIYLHKHHDILDMADEYHRTNDFTSFKTILQQLLESPDSSNIISK